MVKINQKYKKIIAFSLAEALISMMIIMITVICTAPVLTKMKSTSGLKHNTIKGSYTCFPEWVDSYTDKNGNQKKGYRFRSLYCEEGRCKLSANEDNTPRYFDEIDEDTGELEGCKMVTNSRPARYLIIATGAGYYDTNGKAAFGQIKTLYTDEITGTISLKPGISQKKYGLDITSPVNINTRDTETKYETADEWESRVTKFKVGASSDKIASPGYYTDNGLINDKPFADALGNRVDNEISEDNIKSFIFLNKQCPDPDKQKDSEGHDIYVEKNPEFYASDHGLINVVSGEDVACKEFQINENTFKGIKIDDLIKCSNQMECNYEYVDGSYEYKFNVEFDDSSYKSGKTFTAIEEAGEYSFLRILNNMSALRQNETYRRTVIDPRFGSPGKPGAVTVLW